jgi:sialate O-acetylesterase
MALAARVKNHAFGARCVMRRSRRFRFDRRFVRPVCFGNAKTSRNSVRLVRRTARIRQRRSIFQILGHSIRKPEVRATLSLLIALVPALGLSADFADHVPLKEDYQVLQRDSADECTCTVVLPATLQSTDGVAITVEDARGKRLRRVKPAPVDLRGGTRGVVIKKLPVGGPYTITIAASRESEKGGICFRNILVGDVWILGGQSNMFGIDVIKEELPALPYVNMLNVLHFEQDAHWCAGKPPIHRIPEPFAQSTLKSQHPEYSDAKIREILESKTAVGGIDCSYFFARKLYAESGVPIGLIPCATGAALAHWNPDERDQNRYGFLAHHVEGAGGRVKGMLFFQGEQDAIFGDEGKTVTKPTLIAPITTYGDQFIHFVKALRKEFGGSDMPVIYAQICRHHNSPVDRSRGWEIIREAQRTIPARLPNAHCVPSINLDLMDGLHLDYDSLKTIGEQMAYLALPYVKKGISPRTEIRLKSAAFNGGLRPRIVVEFTGVQGRLKSKGRPTGFAVKERQTGKLLDWIYKVEFDPSRPSAVILHATSIPNPDVVLYYGAGVAPYVNIVDEDGMSLPAFGPVEVKQSEP